MELGSWPWITEKQATVWEQIGILEDNQEHRHNQLKGLPGFWDSLSKQCSMDMATQASEEWSASWIDGCSIFLEKNIQLVLKIFMSAPHLPICISPICSNQKRLHAISNTLVVLNLLPREFLQAFSPLPFRICFSYCVQIQNSSTSKPR